QSNMKKWPIALLATVLLVGGVAYAERGALRDAWAAMHAPVLPPAKHVLPVAPKAANTSGDDASPVEGGTAASEHYQLISSPLNPTTPQVDPLAVNGPLPAEVNLDVPFTIQAPNQDWSGPFEDTCEEASILMVNDYYQGQSGTIPADQANTAILALVDYEN